MIKPQEINDLPDALRVVDELAQVVGELQKKNTQLSEELELFKRKYFGRSSERHVEDPSQLRLFDLGGETIEEVEEETEEETKPTRGGRNRSKKSVKLPAHLPRRVIEADVDESERICPCCSEVMPITGTDVTERPDIEPAKMFVWEIHRHKRTCSDCKEVVAQVAAGEEPCGLTTPVPGSDYGFGVYTQIITNKYADHLPLYRGEDIFASAGLLIPRNTQHGMLLNITKVIDPLVGLMKKRVVRRRLAVGASA